MTSLTIDPLGWAPIMTGHPRMQLPNKGPGELEQAILECITLDRLSQGAS